jgi:hypothetical protein
MNDYLGQEALTVSVSPGRVVYLFPAGSRLNFRRAVQEASSRWCGVTEPIIPVRKGGGLDSGWAQIAMHARPFRAVNVGCPESDATRAAQTLGLDLTDLSRIDHDSGTQAIHWSFVTTTVSNPVAARERSDLWEAVAAGDPLDPTDAPALREPVRLASDDGAGRAGLLGNSVLDAGVTGFSYWAGSGGSSGPTAIWVTKPNSLPDCLWFWNMRALQGHGMFSQPMYLIPEHAIRYWVDLKLVLLGQLQRSYRGRPTVVLLSKSVDERVLRDLARALRLKRHRGKNSTFPLFETASTSADAEDRTYALNMDPRIWMLSENAGGYQESTKVQRFRKACLMSCRIRFLSGCK